jgi:site-specific DNA-cytosine methylase
VAKSLRQQGAFAWTSDTFGDERNTLMLHYVMFLEALEPDFFVFENVSNFQSTLKTPDGVLQADQVLEEAVRNLSGGELRYAIAAKQLSAADFGVPQARLRYIMFGVNSARFDVEPDDFFATAKSPRQIGVGEALFGLPSALEFTPSNTISTDSAVECAIITPPKSDLALSRFFDWIQQPIGSVSSVTNAHIYRRMREDDAVFFEFVGPGIRWMDWELRASPTLKALRAALKPKDPLREVVEGNLALRLILEETRERNGLAEQHLLQSSYLKNRSGTHGDWLERLAGDRPSKTIVAHIGKDTYAYIHPFENRPISIREAARLQSFPDGFSFAQTGVVDAYTAIGNAVPPLLASAFASKVEALLYRDGSEGCQVIPFVGGR